MISEKLDQVIAAEESARERIAEAERDAELIIAKAKAEAELKRNEKLAEARASAGNIIEMAAIKCNEISESYMHNAKVEADRIGSIAAKNEKYGMSSVLQKIIP